MKIEYSSICLGIDNYKQKIDEARTLIERENHVFGIQLHNSINREMYDCLRNYYGEIPFSVHSPLFSKHFVNLASLDIDTAVSILQDCDQLTTTWGTDIIFFHGFFMTELPIIQDLKNYRMTMKRSISEQFCLNKSFIMNPEVFETEHYSNYRTQFSENIRQLTTLFPNKIISLENDFVGIGSGLQRPQEILSLIDNLWFDLGHFWCASLLHKFDFHEEAYRIIDQKKVVGVHLNHNLIKKSSIPELIGDSHAHLYCESEMNLFPIIRKLADKGVDSLTLEIVDGDIEDVKIVLDWLS